MEEAEAKPGYPSPSYPAFCIHPRGNAEPTPFSRWYFFVSAIIYAAEPFYTGSLLAATFKTKYFPIRE